MKVRHYAMTRSFSLIFLLILGTAALTNAASITDVGNPHNMSYRVGYSGPMANSPGAGGTDQICIFCHTPHSASPKGPLWNRIDPKGPSGDGTFPLYNTTSLAINFDAAAVALSGYENVSKDSEGKPLYPNGASRLCLSCHDGVTSIGVLLGNQTIAMNIDFATAISLETSHPISFNYNLDVINTLLGPTNYLLPDGTVDIPLAGGKMQCTTCHDPHEYVKSEVPYIPPFWRHTDYKGVCDSCHVSPEKGLGPSPPPVHP